MTAVGSTDVLRFLLNDQVIELKNINPNQTVLQYLREVRRATGSKEGCAEGDCGACTVAIGEIKDGALQYRAVNACIQFLASLHGKQLMTVEHVQNSDGSLHPVQSAMIEHHGSQCGFCTPGFIMSMFVHYRENEAPSRAEIDDMLAGNLCRCTGYGPIISAMTDACQKPEPAEWSKRRSNTAKILSVWADDDNTLELSGSHGRFVLPRRIDELGSILIREQNATLVAGATDVGLWVTKMGRRLDPIIYLADVRELQQISITDDKLIIGAAVTYEAALTEIAGAMPSLVGLISRIGSRQIRNVGTIGGNIANGSPIGDMPPPLIAAAAKLVLRRGDKERRLDLEDYFIGYGEQDIAAGEFVAALEIPLQGINNLRAYKISKRFDQDITACLGSFNLDFEGDTISGARICYGGMAATPQRADNTETALIGKIWNETTVNKAQEVLLADFTPLSDMRASADYRMRVAQNLLRKYYLEISQAKPEQLDRRSNLGAVA